MAKEPKTRPRITQTAQKIVTVTGPVKIRGSHAYDAAGNRVARVGIDQDDDE
ncbi:hypothetical protein [Streptosporangium sp. NPDC006007]|uniref:hypothetical protein n=1 Tax=Streptosporangium sp. NPDC006007 TaxID=3154575 RepID=UPI0033A43E03